MKHAIFVDCALVAKMFESVGHSLPVAKLNQIIYQGKKEKTYYDEEFLSNIDSFGDRLI